MKLTKGQKRILNAIAGEYFLKSHRDIEGNKSYQLHPLNGEPEHVSPQIVEFLRDNGLIDSNKKFPVATFWLTDKGKEVISG
jgi:hypothetical protein